MTEAVVSGWEALARGSWSEALDLLGDAEQDPEALEVAAVANWWLDDADATLGTRERAYRLYQRRGDRMGAARMANALAWDAILFGGRMAVARGWLARAARLLGDEPTCAEHAWLAVREAEVNLADGDPVAAREAAQRAISIAAELGDEEIEIVGRSLEGLSLVFEGLVGEGMRRLDESAAAATAGDIKDLMWVGKVCCNMIRACEVAGDVERATQWCAEVTEFAERFELRTLFNVCRTQYAAVLVQTGAWREAESELESALAVLSRGRRLVVSDGTALLGELRRRQGRLDEARSLFARSERSWVARIGVVELSLDEGDAATALAGAERLERSTAGGRQLERVSVLSVLTRAAVAAGRVERALEASSELDALVEVVETSIARGAAALAGGEIALARDDLEGARGRFEDAVDLLAPGEAPYELARARLALAGVLYRLHQTQRARAEAGAARRAFRVLDASRDMAAAARMLERSGAVPVADGPLTRREREVLVLVAAGDSNRRIASELVISEHTVHRHVANILRKLGEPTRAAAAARAARDGFA